MVTECERPGVKVLFATNPSVDFETANGFVPSDQAALEEDAEALNFFFVGLNLENEFKISPTLHKFVVKCKRHDTRLEYEKLYNGVHFCRQPNFENKPYHKSDRSIKECCSDT